MKNTFCGFLSICLLFPIITFSQLSIEEHLGMKDLNKPNIIFILTDDQRWDALGYAGNPIIQTPNMDQLAEAGTFFKNAFVTTPICAASRASIMTGMYERTHGFTFGTKPLKEQMVNISYPKLLKENGYQTGFIGKFGMSYENKLDTTLFDFYERPGERSGAINYFRIKKDHTGHKHLTAIIGDYSLDFLREYAAKGPFCLSISFHAPHAEDSDPRQYLYPMDLDSLYKDAIIPAPNLLDQKYFDEQPKWVQEGLNKLRWLWRFDTAEKYQQMVKGYYRMISGVDREIGRIRHQLEQLGIADNTVVILMGDNGYFLGERKLAGKWLMYDNSLRVPLIIYDPNVANEKTIEEQVLNIDIAPTILQYAGINIPDKMQGAPLLKLMQEEHSNWRESFLCEHLFNHNRIAKSEGIRTKDWKYFRYLDHPEWEELYDLKNDPLETNNLIHTTRVQPILDQLKKDLDAFILKGSKQK